MVDGLGRVLRRWTLVLAAWSVAGLGVAASERSASYRAALESISAGQLQQYVDYLAADALEGREAGTRGGRAAGDFLAAQAAARPPLRGGAGNGFFQHFSPNFRNVLVLLEGSDPQLKHQFLILGAHYDHIGYGNSRTSLDGFGQIHNGADDNASGVAGLLELAEAFALLPEPPKRSILFAFWDAEEKGILGSRHWVAHPTVPINQVAFYLNMDMIGRLRNDQVTVLGTRSGYGLRRLASQQNQQIGLVLEFPWKIAGDADHYPFFERNIPVLMLHTGVHEQYHRATDDSQWINAPGMERVVRLMFGIAYELANNAHVPSFRVAARQETQEPQNLVFGQTTPPDRLGIACQREAGPSGQVRVTSVTLGSPAHLAGLQLGDRIVRFAGREVRSSEELARLVLAAPNSVTVVVQRDGQPEPMELTLQLAGSPLRLGITWRVDDAEPGVVILTHVAPNSPAAQAGLEPGDRIYQIAGQDFQDEREFARLAKALPGPIRVLVERRGQLRVVEIVVDPLAMGRAA